MLLLLPLVSNVHLFHLPLDRVFNKPTKILQTVAISGETESFAMAHRGLQAVVNFVNTSLESLHHAVLPSSSGPFTTLEAKAYLITRSNQSSGLAASCDIPPLLPCFSNIAGLVATQKYMTDNRVNYKKLEWEATAK